MSNKDNQTESQEPRLEEQSQPSTDTTQDHQKTSEADQAAADSAFDEPEKGSDQAADKPPKKPRSSGKSGTGPIKWFIFLILFAAIGYAVYFGWQKWQDYQTNLKKADRIDHIEQQLSQQQSRIQSRFSEQSRQLTTLSTELEQSQRYISQLQDQLRTTQRKFQALSSEKQQDWLLNEAEYLIREASYKLSFTDDAASIIALLQAADAQLAEFNDGSLTRIRQAISDDINAVRASGNLDIEGIAISLETLKTNLNQLELASIQLDSQSHIEDAPNSDEETSRWQHFKNSLSNAASKYYTVHHFDESAQPFISPQKDRLLRENILLNLQTAQLAALQSNQTLYQSNLLNVKQWVEQYFKQQPATTQAYLEQIDELLARSVELDLPQSLQSYQLISQLSQQKVNQWLESQDNSEDTTNDEEPSS
ncbi:uroporphyrinogen-III C-methyltransferase [Kangiella marina]|uniref:Uroporphyrin-3 C-methyltransferase n=1 Tax=Kangiella marina TaxID=1079178 RepID=A0ABP8IJZ3_9GAMM